MKLLVIGSGGREHALAWRLARSPRVHKVYVAPGNGGTQRAEQMENIALTNAEELADFVQREGIALTVVGPEAPLAAGVVDVFRARGLKIFGPTKAAAQLESSKDYAKAFMVRHNIPTARYETFTDPARAHAYIDAEGAPIVIKADGLAAGKGVVVAATLEEAHAAVDAMLGDGSMGEAGARVVIEECLVGEEASFIVMCDGRNVLALATSQDHKRLQDGDQGPNTGGMGAYSPARVLTPELEQQAIDRIVRPTVDTLREEGTPFSGVLYAGLMLTAQGPKLIEYNARFGDPECQVLMLRFQGDLLAVMLAVAEGRLADLPEPAFSSDPALTVVMAAAGYPGTPKAGGAIAGIDAAEATGAVVFQAGTRQDGETLVASGGRVLAVTASAATVGEAQAAAYRAVDAIRFPDGFCRRDIGWREIAREAGTPA